MLVEIANKASLLTSSAWLFTRAFDLLTPTAFATVEQSQLANTLSQVAEATYALETLALARLRTPLPVRAWPIAGEFDSGDIAIDPGGGTDDFCARGSRMLECRRLEIWSGGLPILKIDPAS